MRTTAMFTLLAALSAAPATLSAQESHKGRFEVQVDSVEGERVLTVRANEASVEAVVRAVAMELGWTVQGFDRVAYTSPITVYLEKRPLTTALHWVFGAAGLRARFGSDSMTVMDDTSPYPTSGEVFDIAETSYLRALRHYPSASKAPQAEMSLGEIQESRGALGAAVKHYDYLIEKHFDSPYVPEAMRRSGFHLEALEEWDGAATRFGDLANLDRDHPHHQLARLELARSFCHLDQPQKALHTLDALETHYPTEDSKVRRDRLLVRARALALTGDSVESLRALDLAARYSVKGIADHEIMELRALALDRGKRPGEASIAYLVFASTTEGAAQGKALKNAARLAQDAGDEIGVLLVHRLAREKGHEGETEYFANEARTRLGLAEESLDSFDDRQKLERAVNLFQQNLVGEAARALGPLFERRSSFEPADRLRLVLTYARALESDGAFQRAIGALRRAAPEFEKLEDRRQVYLLAASMYEDKELYDEALDAVQGRL